MGWWGFEPCGWHPARRPQPHGRNQPWRRLDPWSVWDVHATKIVAAVLDADTGELGMFVLNGENAGVAALCAGLPRPVWAAYEAGPTGYTLARELAKRGIECVVAAPSKIPRATGDKVKNDRRDVEHLVRLLLAGS